MSGRGRAKPFDVVLMFDLLILQQLHNLSYDGIGISGAGRLEQYTLDHNEAWRNVSLMCGLPKRRVSSLIAAFRDALRRSISRSRISIAATYSSGYSPRPANLSTIECGQCGATRHSDISGRIAVNVRSVCHITLIADRSISLTSRLTLGSQT